MNRPPSSYILSASLLSLAGAIFYLTYTLSTLPNKSEDVMKTLERVSLRIEPAIAELKGMQNHIPRIMEEVKHVRELVPSVLSEVEMVRMKIPEVLKETKEIRLQVPVIISEVEKSRAMIPDILEEVSTTREAIPAILNQAQMLIKDAENVGKTASEGAVSGIFTGILKAPFRLSSQLGNSLLGNSKSNVNLLTQADKFMLLDVVNQLILSQKPGETLIWSNPESQNRGSVTFMGKNKSKQQKYYDFKFIIDLKDGKKIDRVVSLFRDDKSQWSIAN